MSSLATDLMVYAKIFFFFFKCIITLNHIINTNHTQFSAENKILS